jgi:cytochrome c5
VAQQSQRIGAARWPVYLVITLFILAMALFLIQVVVSTGRETAVRIAPAAEFSAAASADQVADLLADASSERGAKLVEQYGCVACHREGVASNIAPPFAGLAERAAMRFPPRLAAAYIYESITSPVSYIVEGFNPVMPQDYPMRLSNQELGDIIAYLLTGDAY